MQVFLTFILSDLKMAARAPTFSRKPNCLGYQWHHYLWTVYGLWTFPGIHTISHGLTQELGAFLRTPFPSFFICLLLFHFILILWPIHYYWLRTGLFLLLFPPVHSGFSIKGDRGCHCPPHRSMARAVTSRFPLFWHCVFQSTTALKHLTWHLVALVASLAVPALRNHSLNNSPTDALFW